jgi:UDP-N-acetylmuramate dehydrogenase
MLIETNVDLRPYNTFGLSALAPSLIRIRSQEDLVDLLRQADCDRGPGCVLGGGSNIVLSERAPAVILKVEITGRRLFLENENEWIVEAGAGENWHDLVAWTLSNDWPGLENLALIPGTAGAAPIQNIGAYGVELKDRLLSVDAVDLKTGRIFSLTAEQCRFGYRDSIFKHELAGRCMVTRVRLRLPKPWKPVLDYPDLRHRWKDLGPEKPTAAQICEWVCDLRRAKLPDPAHLGNAGSFFKNPVVDRPSHALIAAHWPNLVYRPLPDGNVKLSAGWMIEACGWKGKQMGRVGVCDRQALVLVNHGGASARELMTLADAIRDSVYQRFGIRLEMEPTVI